MFKELRWSWAYALSPAPSSAQYPGSLHLCAKGEGRGPVVKGQEEMGW